jgi:hypothetical protein
MTAALGRDAIFFTCGMGLPRFFGARRRERRKSRRPLAPSLVVFLTTFLICGLASATDAKAQTGPFSAYAGSWTGAGVITVSNGGSERIRCRARYSVLQSDTDLNQELRCASDSYHFELKSVLLADPEGRIRGTWEETTRRANGSVSGQLAGGVVTGHVEGTGFTADMTVTLRGDRQSLRLVPSGADITLVTIEMRRD